MISIKNGAYGQILIYMRISASYYLPGMQQIQGGPIKNKQISNKRHFKSLVYPFFKISAFPLYQLRVIGLKNDGNWTSSSEDMPILENLVENRVNSL